eukprot:7693711-Pyramimonas_sp.AAC.1
MAGLETLVGLLYRRAHGRGVAPDGEHAVDVHSNTSGLAHVGHHAPVLYDAARADASRNDLRDHRRSEEV